MKIQVKIFFLISMFANSLTITKGSNFSLLVQQLDKHINLLNQFNTNNKLSIDISVLLEDLDSFDFKNDLIRFCISEMKKSKNLNDLVKIWNNYKEETKRIDNLTFIKEIATILLIVYKNILVKIYPQLSTIPIPEILSIYQKALTLPIDELLNSLNDLATKIEIIISSLTIIDKNLSWLELLKKYWYIPSSIGASILTLILHNLLAK